VKSSPQMYFSPRLGFLRNFVSHIGRHPNDFPPVDGDDTITIFIKCVCEVIPVNQRNLQAIKEDCYFATDNLESMSNSHKRNMIYWWYATNVFSISGKGTRGQLPLCLEYEIRKEFPNPDGVPYKGYKGRHNKKRKN
jgi:hypothetical protein